MSFAALKEQTIYGRFPPTVVCSVKLLLRPRITVFICSKNITTETQKLDGAMSEAPFGEDHHGNHNSFLNTVIYITGR